MRALKFREFDDVGLAPFEKLLPNLRGGFASPEKLPARFRHRRRGKLKKDQAVVAGMAGAQRLEPNPGQTFVYGGVLHWHFGHLISEFLHRLWVLRQPGLESATVLFVGKPHVPQIFRDCMQYFGVRNWQIVDRPSVVSRLIVAEQGKSIGEAPHPTYDAYLARLALENGLSQQETPARIALMRGHLADRRFLGETAVEGLLQREGYVLFRPENHGLRHQLATLLNAEEIVMSDGSAGHLFDLLPRTTARVALISRAGPSEWKPRDAIAVVNSVEIKCRETRVFNDTCQIAAPLNDGRQKPTGLRYVPLDQLVSFLAEHHFVRAGATFETAPNIYEDFQAYARLHLSDQLGHEPGENELLGYLATQLHASMLEKDGLKERLVRRRGLRGFLADILGRSN